MVFESAKKGIFIVGADINEIKDISTKGEAYQKAHFGQQTLHQISQLPLFMSPHQVGNIVDKFAECGNDKVILCERGHCHGYDNLIVDPLAFGVMKELTQGTPIILDSTHATQQRDSGSAASGGRRKQVPELSYAGLATGIAGLFIEAHANPAEARCDGPSALPFAKLAEFLTQAKAIDDVVKSFTAIDID